VCRGYAVESYYNTCWVTGHWSTEAKVEGIVLKAAWDWGSDSRVVNDPLGGPGCTPLYVRLLSAWGFVDGDRMFLSHFVGVLLKWLTLTDINE